MTNEEKVEIVQRMAEEAELAGVIVIGWTKTGPGPKDYDVFYAGDTAEGQAEAERAAQLMSGLTPFFNQ